MANGRVDLVSPLPAAQGLAAASYWMEPSAGANRSLHREAVQGVLTRTPLSELYFSAANAEALQQGLRYKVYVATGRVVGRQSDSELSVFMRTTFLQEARHLPTNVMEQVRVLNAQVLAKVVPVVIGNMEQHDAYRRDVSTLPVPLEKGLSTSTRGSRVVELSTRF